MCVKSSSELGCDIFNRRDGKVFVRGPKSEGRLGPSVTESCSLIYLYRLQALLKSNSLTTIRTLRVLLHCKPLYNNDFFRSRPNPLIKPNNKTLSCHHASAIHYRSDLGHRRSLDRHRRLYDVPPAPSFPSEPCRSIPNPRSFDKSRPPGDHERPSYPR